MTWASFIEVAWKSGLGFILISIFYDNRRFSRRLHFHHLAIRGIIYCLKNKHDPMLTSEIVSRMLDDYEALLKE